MAQLEKTITVTAALRPCYVHNKKALFHKWIDEKEVELRSAYSNGGEISATFGLVEYENGTVEKVYPSNIQFADREFAKYAFIPREAEAGKIEILREEFEKYKSAYEAL